jgi:hypothetical protein
LALSETFKLSDLNSPSPRLMVQTQIDIVLASVLTSNSISDRLLNTNTVVKLDNLGP